MALFVVDHGGMYDLQTVDGSTTHLGTPGPILTVRGVRSEVTYVSAANRVEVTGKRRQHVGVGVGQRARLHLDTGEGGVILAGVYREDH